MWLQKVGKKGRLLGILLGIIIFLQGCLKNDADVYDPNKVLEEDLVKIDQYISDKNWTASIEPEFKIRYVIHKPGDQNVKAEVGDSLTVDYQGELLDGTIFDSSAGRGPLEFVLGNGSLIVGFEAGVSQLHEMDSATILIPSVYAYGNSGAGTAIPPNAPIIFGLDVLSVKKSGQ
ncbi:MAG: FKBP-type peptidyl-prolyl cis-trans isomerase [Cyclobacteriaceae bacterium]|nr:FKBP-type peptidyl-prolyl cis-trans isomerase [Cyclobacteriaceae bacterium]